MLKVRISETSARVPAALFILELMVFFAAVLTTAYLDLFPDGRPAGMWLWLLRALVFSLAIMICMAVLKLYQGRPRERMGVAMLRLLRISDPRQVIRYRVSNSTHNVFLLLASSPC